MWVIPYIHLRPGTVQNAGTMKLLMNACLLGSSVTHCCVAQEPFWLSCICVLYNTPSLYLILISRYTRESGHSATSWYDKGWSPSTNKHQTTKSSYSGWSKRSTRGNPSECEGRHSYWDDGEAQDSANDTEGVAMEGKDKTHGREKGVEEEENAPSRRV